MIDTNERNEDNHNIMNDIDIDELIDNSYNFGPP